VAFSGLVCEAYHGLLAHHGLCSVWSFMSLWQVVALSSVPIVAVWPLGALVLCGLAALPQCGFKLLYLCVVYQCLVPDHGLVSVWSLWSDSVWQRLTR